MMNVYSNKFDIEELLLNKSIDELSPGERRHVLDQMSLDEFSDCQEILSDSIELFNYESDYIQEPIGLRDDLTQRLIAKRREERIFIKSFRELLNYRIPVYKAAFVSIAIVCIVYFFDYSLTNQNGIIFGRDSTANENIIIPLIDTLDSAPNSDKGDSLVSSTDFDENRNPLNMFINDNIFAVAIPISKFCLNGMISNRVTPTLQS